MGNRDIKLVDVHHIISLYADDALFNISSPRSALPRLLRLLEEFGDVSGLCLNRHKSLVFPLAASATTPLDLLLELGLRW
ncbi:hypothetical protein NDU88_003823 [Pleurodeles waltl]|uniref:Reverse transcriptase domain-containing protein n=1 Tax=Pleurodeles waltl TaxID=8319 RepID=A0AAV7KNU8_PLEWA|nr:hypothetical protein NDU88_000154 [Pleurodeles waltl]KAJ1098716.1 hypothetical protein NDU88_003823 [Pleurodeles waltl]